MIETADVVVVGLGAVGSAALHRLALAGASVVGVDRFYPPHDRGSSHGETRISRLAVGEGADYAPLVRRSHAIWDELAAETGQTLFRMTGGLVMGEHDGAAVHHGKGDFVNRTIAVARAYGIEHEVLDAAEIGRRFPQLLLDGDETGYYEPGAGTIFPEACITVQLRLARALGAVAHLGETVLSVAQRACGVEVVTDHRTIHAGRAVLTAGPWMPTLVGGQIGGYMRAYRQTLHWFALDDPAAYAPDRFPIFIWMHGDGEEDYLYGFPAMPGATALKLASERYTDPVDPDSMTRTVARTESTEIHRRHVAGRLRGVGPECNRAAACLYTVTPDSGFIVDHLPGQPDILIASACSGHGFKHSPAVGELIAARIASGTPGGNPFALARFTAAAR